MLSKENDYGYFGKGIDGYVHYKQSFDNNFNNSYKRKKPNKNAGCGTAIIMVLLIIISISAALIYFL